MIDKSKKILVVGDLMLDEYVVGKNYRMSDEAPVPILEVDQFKALLGGAANVAHNIKTLGCHITLCGAIGLGHSGQRFLKLLGETGIAAENIVSSSDCWTTTKTRVLINNQQIVRYDYEKLELDDKIKLQLCEKLTAINYDEIDVIIVSDYCKGTITSKVMDILLRTETDVIVDPKFSNQHLYRDIFCLTPNIREFSEMAEKKFDGSYSGLAEAAKQFISERGIRNLVITLGKDGAFYCDGVDSGLVRSVKKEFTNIIGAGDTFISALAVATASNQDIASSVSFANSASGVVVSKQYTSVCHLDELF